MGPLERRLEIEILCRKVEILANIVKAEVEELNRTTKTVKELKEDKINELKNAGFDEDFITNASQLPMTSVKTPNEKMFFIKVFHESNCTGLFADIVEAIENLEIDVLHVRVSGEDQFLVEAFALKRGREKIEAAKVEEAMSEAIEKWSEKE